MRLDDLELHEFRCFRSRSIDLSADVTAIYGRNGTGKTALFDGIEFALFGDITRLGKTPEARRALRNVYAESENQTLARLGFRDDSGLSISTFIDSDGNSRLAASTWPAHRDFLYQRFIDSKYFPPRQEVARVESMFRASLLLSQETLDHFVHGASEERAAVLATLAGAGYLQRCKDRVTEVLDEAHRRLRRLNDQLEEAVAEHSDLQRQLSDRKARVEELAQQIGGGGMSAPQLKDLLARAGISIPATGIPEDAEGAEDFAARVAAVCDERLRSLAGRRSRLHEVSAGMEDYRQQLTRFEQAQQELREVRSLQAAATERVEQLRGEHRHLTDAIAEVGRVTEQLADAVEALQRSGRVRPELEAAKAEGDVIEVRVAEARAQVESLTQNEVRLQGTSRESALTLEQQNQRVREGRAHVDGFIALERDLQAYEEASAELTATSERIATDQAALDQINVNLAETEGERRRLQGKVAEVTAAFTRLRSDHDERDQLAAQLLSLVSGARCPACGKAHPSEADVREAIKLNLGSPPAHLAEMTTQQQSLQREAAAAEERARTQVQERDAIEARLEDAKRRAQLLASQREQFQHRALAYSLEPTRAAIANALVEVRAALEASEAAAERAREGAERARSAHEDAQVRRVASESQLQVIAEQLERQSERVRELRQSLADAQTAVDLAPIPGNDEAAPAGLTEALDASHARRSELEVERQRVEDASAAASRESSSLGQQESTLAQAITELSRKIEAFRDLCVAADLDREVDLTEAGNARTKLDSLMKALAQAQATGIAYARGLRLTALRAERAAIDQSASRAEIRVQEFRDQLTSLDRAREVAQRWLDPLSREVRNTVEDAVSEHGSAINRYFKALTPSPHAFRDVLLRYSDEKLELGISYRGLETDSGEPKYYLSKAQANVLAIAIFLSFGLRASWSRLDTLLLDDPVQHLDDLDAAAFLDTIRAAALGRFGLKKQIVVSTCDRNLYLLMLRKFSEIRGRDVSFTGISLVDGGSGGPDIIYDVGGPDQNQPAWQMG